METKTAKQTVRILHLEDTDSDQIFVKEMLASERFAAEITVVNTRAAFESALRTNTFDLIISDYSLPSFDGVAALAITKKARPELPFLFFSGTMGEELAVDSLRGGAVDYVLKQRPARLLPAIRRAIEDAQERARLRGAEEKIREQAALLDKASDAIILCSLDERVSFWNQGAERVYGWTAGEAVGKHLPDLLFGGNPPPEMEAAMKSLNERGEWAGELRQQTRDHRKVTVQARVTLIREEGGQPKSLLIINTDITERKQLEEQFLRSQRMESIGALAGGVAHDLNNALTPVLIGADLLRQNVDEDQREKLLDLIYTSARRGSEMVKQILTFARGSQATSAPVQLTHLIKEMIKIARDTFPKLISVQADVNPRLWTMIGDVTELHQVLLNLCVNARDAMPEGGKLLLTAENIVLEPKDIPSHAEWAAPGSHVMLSVADTGTGIPADVLPRIFEPFFTTKAPDKGTGLGLSTVASIIKHHKGFLQVVSAVGKGTEFKIYLPALEASEVEETKPEQVVLPSGHGELILVMDDEEAVRELARTTLENYGYRVVTAPNGMQGIARFEEHKAEIKLLVTDSDMPFMDGVTAVAAIQRACPDIPIIIASGAKGDTEQFRRINTTHLITFSKPYTVEQLVRGAAQALKTSRPPGFVE